MLSRHAVPQHRPHLRRLPHAHAHLSLPRPTEQAAARKRVASRRVRQLTSPLPLRLRACRRAQRDGWARPLVVAVRGFRALPRVRAALRLRRRQRRRARAARRCMHAFRRRSVGGHAARPVQRAQLRRLLLLPHAGRRPRRRARLRRRTRSAEAQAPTRRRRSERQPTARRVHSVGIRTARRGELPLRVELPPPPPPPRPSPLPPGRPGGRAGTASV